jgi:nitroreductase
MTPPALVPVPPDRDVLLAARRRAALRRVHRSGSAARMRAMLLAAESGVGRPD